MPEIRVTDDQLDRLDDVREDLETEFVGEYGSVTPNDAIEYLLDTYSPPDAAEGDAEGTADGATDPDEAADTGESAAADGGASATNGGGVPAGGGGGSPLAAAAKLMTDNEEHWRESDGEAPYEVDLPDGSTEAVRTKDDVKRLLFKHYR